MAGHQQVAERPAQIHWRNEVRGNLIDRYVMEVGRQLPEKNRADVQLELRSSLLDALEERGLDADSKEDEAKIAELLKEFGKPSHVAAGYGARTHLIGPELQPYYWLVLRLSVLVLAVVHLVMLGLAAFSQPSIALIIGETIGNFINGFLMTFASVTIIFALLEHFLPTLWSMAEPHHRASRGEWDPQRLPEISPDRDKVNVVDLIVELVFTAAFISVINLAPGWQFPADLAIAEELIAKFLPFIPWITALGLVQIFLDIYVLTQGRWSSFTRWLAFGHAAGSLALVAATLLAAPFSVVPLVNDIVKISFGIILIMSLIDAAIKLYKAARPNSPLPWEAWRLEEDIEEMGEKAEKFSKALEARLKKPGSEK
jgi:hypothetical protein